MSDLLQDFGIAAEDLRTPRDVQAARTAVRLMSGDLSAATTPALDLLHELREASEGEGVRVQVNGAEPIDLTAFDCAVILFALELRAERRA